VPAKPVSRQNRETFPQADLSGRILENAYRAKTLGVPLKIINEI
jgi:hypothetical protein